MDALWLGRPPASAEAQLQGHISGLRQALGDAGATRRVIVTRSPGYVLETPEGSLDYELFRGEAHQGHGFLIDGDPGSAGALGSGVHYPTDAARRSPISTCPPSVT